MGRHVSVPGTNESFGFVDDYFETVRGDFKL
jgi:hypothetical protein